VASPLTLRLDPKTRKRIARLAHRKNLPTSEVVRQAIEAWVDRHESASTPYEVAADLIGVVHGGIPERSTRTGRRFAKHLKERRSRS